MVTFHPLSLNDGADIRKAVYNTECRNCDLSFMNLVGWRFMYGTELAVYDGWLLFRFRSNGRLAYLPPVGTGDCSAALSLLLADAESLGEPFMMLGVCENTLAGLEAVRPDFFHATTDRTYSDYIYRREVLATLAGKKLQPKRNFANRFSKAHPDYVYSPLTPSDFAECLQLEEAWSAQKVENSSRLSYADERKALYNVFENWEKLGGMGGTIRIDGQLVAFTYGAPINYDTFDVCVEKADTTFEGAYAAINRDFARHIPEQYVLVNREEDLGIEGLRKAKLSYQPEIILHKYTVVPKKEYVAHT